MTNPSTQAVQRTGLVANVSRLTAELAAANADVALFKRLKDAEATAARLAKELAAAQEAVASKIADDVSAAKEAAFARIRQVTIIDSTHNESVVRSSFTIKVTRLAFDSMSGQTVEAVATYQGFEGVPPDIMAYIIERQPSALPAKIMELAPDSPAAAIDRLLISKRRGYLA